MGVFDLRRGAPLVVKDHMYDAPINTIKFHAVPEHGSGGQHVVSADSHVVKVRRTSVKPG